MRLWLWSWFWLSLFFVFFLFLLCLLLLLLITLVVLVVVFVAVVVVTCCCYLLLLPVVVTCCCYLLLQFCWVSCGSTSHKSDTSSNPMAHAEPFAGQASCWLQRSCSTGWIANASRIHATITAETAPCAGWFWMVRNAIIVACGLCGYGSICLAFAARSPFEDSKAITDT